MAECPDIERDLQALAADLKRLEVSVAVLDGEVAFTDRGMKSAE